MDIDLKRLRALMRSLQEFDIAELELEDSDLRIVIRRRLAPEVALQTASSPAMFSMPPAATVQPPPPAGEMGASGAASEASEPEDPSLAYVTSPFVGTFYRAPAPGAKPFVEPGQQVDAGQTLCIVEAMKLMNEIEAEFPCTILEVLVENGEPVEYGDRLFKVRKQS